MWISSLLCHCMLLNIFCCLAKCIWLRFQEKVFSENFRESGLFYLDRLKALFARCMAFPTSFGFLEIVLKIQWGFGFFFCLFFGGSGFLEVFFLSHWLLMSDPVIQTAIFMLLRFIWATSSQCESHVWLLSLRCSGTVEPFRLNCIQILK